MINFISKHLIKKIEEEVKKKKKILDSNYTFLYFDEVIDDPKKRINRVDTSNPYPVEEILPVSYYFLSAKTLIKIYHNLKSNKFYTYKTIDNKSHKVRIKNKI